MDAQNNESLQKEDWPTARPQKMAKPTYWPFFFAVGIAFLFWGMLTIWIVSVAGLVVAIFSLAGWINDIRHE